MPYGHRNTMRMEKTSMFRALAGLAFALLLSTAQAQQAPARLDEIPDAQVGFGAVQELLLALRVDPNLERFRLFEWRRHG